MTASSCSRSITPTAAAPPRNCPSSTASIHWRSASMPPICSIFQGSSKAGRPDFRNYARAELKLAPRPVVLIGDNGSGKTNLLEAVSLLGPGQGLRGRPYGELCRKEGAGGFAVAAMVVSRQDEVEIGTGLAAGF